MEYLSTSEITDYIDSAPDDSTYHKIFRQIFNILEQFGLHKERCFKRIDTLQMFVILVIGFLVREDNSAITTIVDALHLKPKYYRSLIHALHSEAWDLHELRKAWYEIIYDLGLLKFFKGRIILLGDGCKQYHDGKKMAGVVKMIQESESQSKPQYIFGQLFGCMSVLIEFEDRIFSLPLKMTIQGGIAYTASWEGSEHPYADQSHIKQMMRDCVEIATEIKSPVYCVMDRYFASQDAFFLIDELCGKRDLDDSSQCRRVELITSLKSNASGKRPYIPDPNLNKTSGRPRKYDDTIKLWDIFKEETRFRKTEVNIYGESEELECYSENIYWGNKWRQIIKIVWVKSRKGFRLLLSTDVTLSDEEIIKLYSCRMQCEEMYREGKQVFGTFFGHYFTYSMPELNRFKSKNDPDPLEAIIDPDVQEKILDNIHAMEAHVLVASVAQGIAQIIAITQPVHGEVQLWQYKRTYTEKKVSERSVCCYIRDHFPVVLQTMKDHWIVKLIRRCQRRSLQGAYAV